MRNGFSYLCDDKDGNIVCSGFLAPFFQRRHKCVGNIRHGVIFHDEDCAIREWITKDNIINLIRLSQFPTFLRVSVPQYEACRVFWGDNRQRKSDIE